MQAGPVVSVVIPLYNKASHIDRALDSVFAQSMPPTEVIVVDDGSTDGGGDVAIRYADRGARLVRQENCGVSAARNRGISEARGDLVAFLDADDEWLPEHLATVARLTTEYPGCGAYAQAFEVVTKGDKRWIHVTQGIPAFPWEGIIPNYFHVAPAYPVWTSAVAIPRHVFDVVGLFVGLAQPAEDTDMWSRIALRFPICLSTRVGAIYHKDAENRTDLRQRLAEHTVVEVIRNALREGLVPPEVRRDAYEFVAYLELAIASANVGLGNPRYARQLLMSCRGTRRYAYAWWRLMLQTMLPPGWPARLRAAREAMRSLAGRHE